MIDKNKRDEIASQCIDEIQFARNSRQQKLQGWWKNEDLYFSKKVKQEGQRANVNLNEGQSFVNTFLSKINTPYNWKYTPWEEADTEQAKILNAIKDKDAKIGNWQYKIMLGRIQRIIYGRDVYEYHADSINKEYRSHLSNVDVYQFLIDPSCWGLDIEQAYYMGRGWIVKTEKQIKEGVKQGRYLRTESEELLSGSGDAQKTKEDIDAENRYITLISGDKFLQNRWQWKFWEWYTTYEGTRYYVLLTETGGKAIRIEKLSDIFASDKYPFFTAAAYPDLTEFWTPSPLDGVREILSAKSMSINQMLDNAEAINRPMKAFDVNAIQNPQLLKYRPDGLIPVKAGFNIQSAIQFYPTIPLNTALEVYDRLDVIQATQSGVTNASKGLADETRVGIYEGNIQQAADRFATLQESEAMAQKRFAELYMEGLEEHMTGEMAVEMIGLDGVEYVKVTKDDIVAYGNFDIQISTAGSEQAMQDSDKRNKIAFIQANKMNPELNQKVLLETEAQIAGFTPDEIKALLDKDTYGESELMAECARDIQDILKNKKVKPNTEANTAYKQKIVDFLRDNEDDITEKQAKRLFEYLDTLDPIVMRNMSKWVDEERAKMWLMSQAWAQVEWQMAPQWPLPQWMPPEMPPQGPEQPPMLPMQ